MASYAMSESSKTCDDSDRDESPEEQKHGREQYLTPHGGAPPMKAMGYVYD